MIQPNQIDPYGRPHRHPGRRTATLTGNREYGKAWIICSMDLAWRKEERQYLRLFFLDWATAFAAGFRPCNRCLGPARKSFSQCWSGAHGGTGKTGEIDVRLATERGRLQEVSPSNLPTGTMIEVDGHPWLVVRDRMHPWSFDGYGAEAPLPARAGLITPASTVGVLREGFDVELHQTIDGRVW